MAQALSAAGAAVMIGDILDDVGKQTAEDLRSGGGTAGRGRGAKVAILSGNAPVAFSCVCGISRAGAVWCRINPRNEAAENRELLDLFDCVALMYQRSFDPLVAAIRPDLGKLRTLVCLDGTGVDVVSFDDWVNDVAEEEVLAWEAESVDDIAMIVGTGGTTGQPKGVVLSGHNLESMTALTLMGDEFAGRPTCLALAPLTHAAGVLCFPIMSLGGEIVIMSKPDVGGFLELIERHRVTHTFLPPTLICMLLGHDDLDRGDRSSLQTFWDTAPLRCRRTGWPRRWAGSAPWHSFSAQIGCGCRAPSSRSETVDRQCNRNIRP